MQLILYFCIKFCFTYMISTERYNIYLFLLYILTYVLLEQLKTNSPNLFTFFWNGLNYHPHYSLLNIHYSFSILSSGDPDF